MTGSNAEAARGPTISFHAIWSPIEFSIVGFLLKAERRQLSGRSSANPGPQPANGLPLNGRNSLGSDSLQLSHRPVRKTESSGLEVKAVKTKSASVKKQLRRRNHFSRRPRIDKKPPQFQTFWKQAVPHQPSFIEIIGHISTWRRSKGRE